MCKIWLVKFNLKKKKNPTTLKKCSSHVGVKEPEVVSAAQNLPVALPHPAQPNGPCGWHPGDPAAPSLLCHPPLAAAAGGGCTHGCSPCQGWFGWVRCKEAILDDCISLNTGDVSRHSTTCHDMAQLQPGACSHSLPSSCNG